jgi:chromate transport protein ChrA
MQEETKAVMDVIAVGGTIGTVAGMLPPLAALVTILWTCLRIWETETVQNFINRNKE